MKFINLLDSFGFGGAETVAINYHKVLSELGVNVQTVSMAIERDVKAGEVIGLDSSWKCFKYILNEVRINDGIVIFSHSKKSLFLSSLLKVLFFKKVRLVFIQHLYLSWLKKIAVLLFSLVVDKYLIISPRQHAFYTKCLPKSKVFCFTNFLYSTSNASAVDSRNVRKVAFVGSLKEGKNPHHIFKLAELLNHDDYEFHIVGGGRYYTRIARDAEYHYRNTGHSINVPGPLTDPFSLFGAGDILFFSSFANNEMLPMVILEALEKKMKIVAYKDIVNESLLPKSNIFDFNDFVGIASAIKNDDLSYGEFIYDASYAKHRMVLLLESLKVS